MRLRNKGLKVEKITVTNLNRSYKLNVFFIKNIILKILKLIKRPRIVELEVIFLNDDTMRSLNRRYKGRAGSTDVLSFELDQLGEIFISLDRAKRNAKTFKTTLDKEVVLYLIHAILHLVGYRDKNVKERLRMYKRQAEILNRLCEIEDLSKVLTPQ